MKDLNKIKEHVDLMRWSDHVDEACKGSLADVFWNRDIPFLIEVAERASERVSEDLSTVPVGEEKEQLEGHSSS